MRRFSCIDKDRIQLKGSIKPIYLNEKELLFFCGDKGGLKVYSDNIDLYSFSEKILEGIRLKEILNIYREYSDEALEIIDILKQNNLLLKSETGLTFTKAELEFYDRFIGYLGESETANQDRFEMFKSIRKSKILLFGIGTVGTWVLQHLLACGIGEIVILDNDCIEVDNLSRQSLFTKNDIGKKKSLVAQEFSKKYSDLTEINVIDCWISNQTDLEKIINNKSGFDIVIQTADQPRWDLALWTCEQSIKAEIPYIRANQLGAGPLVIPHETACLGCEKEKLKNTISNAEDLISGAHRIKEMPAPAIGIFPSVTSSILSLEIVHFLAGLDEKLCLKNKRLKCGYNESWSIKYDHLQISESCKVCQNA